MKLLAAFLISTLLLSCKSQRDDSDLSSSGLTDIDLSDKSQETVVDRQFSDKCKVLNSTAEPVESCRHPALLFACETNFKRIDRTVLFALSSEKMLHVFNNESLRFKYSAFLDRHIRSEASKCFPELKNEQQKDVSLAQKNKHFDDFQHWLSQEIVNNFQSNQSENQDIPLAILKDACRTSVNQFVKLSNYQFNTVSECNDSFDSWNKKIQSESVANDICQPELANTKEKIRNVSTEDLTNFIVEFHLNGLKDSCLNGASDQACDLMYTFTESLNKSLKVQELSTDIDGCISKQMISRTEQFATNYKVRKNSEIKAPWFVSDCCHCQLSYYSREFQSGGPPDPINDTFLGVTHHLSNRLVSPEVLPVNCGGNLETRNKFYPSKSSQYDYHRFTDCQPIEIVGGSCPFFHGDEKRRVWNRETFQPENTVLLAPWIDSNRSPDFLHDD